MKRERLSMLVLVVEIAAIIYLHSAKTRSSITGNKMVQNGKSAVTATFQFKVLPITK